MTDSRNDIGAPFPQRKEQSLRDELKNAAYADLTEQGYLPTSKTDRMAVVDIVVDTVEPLIRADQDNRECDHCTDLARLKIADLRAQVEALPEGAERRWDGDDALIWRSDVLALIDGHSDD